MSKPEFGLKRTCVACAVRFYDLRRSPAVCPKCEVAQPALPARALRRALPAIKAAPALTQEEAVDEVLVATDEDEDAPETDDDLDDDDTGLPVDLDKETS